MTNQCQFVFMEIEARMTYSAGWINKKYVYYTLYWMENYTFTHAKCHYNKEPHFYGCFILYMPLASICISTKKIMISSQSCYSAGLIIFPYNFVVVGYQIS